MNEISSEAPSNLVRSRLIGRVFVAAVAALTTVAIVPTSDASAGTMQPSESTANRTAFTPVAPCRLADTRTGAGVERVDANHIRVFVAGHCELPPTATAATLTFTVAGAAAPGFLTAWPSGTGRPDASNLNWGAGNTRANSAMLQLGTDGAIAVYVSTATDVIVDATGAFVPASTARAGRYVPVPPHRAVDTRFGPPPTANTITTIGLPEGVPSDAIAVTANIAAAGQGHGGYFTAWAAGQPRPDASVLNTDAWDQTRSSTTVIPVSAAGLSVFGSAGGHLIVDVTGYFTGESAGESAAGLFVPAPPTRLYDSRVSRNGMLTPRSTQRVAVDVSGAAVVGNWTMADVTDPGYLALRAAGMPLDATSNANGDTGETVANMAVTAVSGDGVDAFTSGGAHVIADVFGYFTGAKVTPPALPYNGTFRSDGRLAGPRNDDGRYRVMYVGDSMAWETKEELQAALPGWEFHEQTAGGTAPCDWVNGGPLSISSRVEVDFVVVSFLGNNLTPCTGGAEDGDLINQYKRDITALCHQLAPANCVLVGQAPLAWDHMGMPNGEPTPLYRSMASSNPWWFVDAGLAVEDDKGGYVPEMRSPDLVHFSPSGATRYANAIATFLTTITP